MIIHIDLTTRLDQTAILTKWLFSIIYIINFQKVDLTTWYGWFDCGCEREHLKSFAYQSFANPLPTKSFAYQ